MPVRPLFEPVSCTYSYLLASCRGGEALIAGPVPGAGGEAWGGRENSSRHGLIAGPGAR